MKKKSKWAVFLAAVIGLARAHAQDFSIDWFDLAVGGGGSSFGGDFELSATIGQSQAGEMFAGDFSVIAGFWSVVTTFETPGAPSLTLTVAGDRVTVSWPENGSAGFVLEETSALADASHPWTLVDTAPDLSNGTNTVRLPLTSGNHFYRLHKP